MDDKSDIKIEKNRGEDVRKERNRDIYIEIIYVKNKTSNRKIFKEHLSN